MEFMCLISGSCMFKINGRLEHWCSVTFDYVYSLIYATIYICLNVCIDLFSTLTFISNCYSSLNCLMKLDTVLLGSLAFQKLLTCAYIAYISKVMATLNFPLKQFRFRLYSLLRKYGTVMNKFTHHDINIMNSFIWLLVP